MSNGNVLIVDDDVNIVGVLVRLFEKMGDYQIITASNGEEALQKARQNHPNLVVLDLKLPRLCGEEVCKQIRKDDSLKDVPIIMLTGKCMDADRVVGKVIGANYYLTKPFDILELIRVAQKFPPFSKVVV